jgi:hypothetical protein
VSAGLSRRPPVQPEPLPPPKKENLFRVLVADDKGTILSIKVRLKVLAAFGGVGGIIAAIVKWLPPH